ncbi:hypothetical protein [Nocardia terpenica]|uniref:hypothetical protein n=1 Tax=Nocardia terpenica TaxID=455432 RepID=UPI0015C5633C|nr:hypothetical protein [Nocardia terpenica]NQE90222.1 hypothetical protein [Nocardia terpenica]
MSLLVVVATVSDYVSARTADEHRDRGDVMEKVIIIAGMVGLAIALVVAAKAAFARYVIQII